jgi:sugar phosphate permease
MASALLTPSKSEAVQAPRSRGLSRVLALLVFSVFINYIDRGNLSIAAPLIKDELGISGSQLGILLSSFFWTYGVFGFCPAGSSNLEGQGSSEISR